MVFRICSRDSNLRLFPQCSLDPSPAVIPSLFSNISGIINQPVDFNERKFRKWCTEAAQHVRMQSINPKYNSIYTGRSHMGDFSLLSNFRGCRRLGVDNTQGEMRSVHKINPISFLSLLSLRISCKHRFQSHGYGGRSSLA